jgi:hypothetical protein
MVISFYVLNFMFRYYHLIVPFYWKPYQRSAVLNFLLIHNTYNDICNYAHRGNLDVLQSYYK